MNNYDKETLMNIIVSLALENTELRQRLESEHRLTDHVIKENIQLRENKQEES